MRRPQRQPILVVEDNADLRESISEILALNGFLANGAENGRDALDMLKQSRPPPALILSDLAMPVMDGITFLHHVKQIRRFSRIPVLLMTAQEVPPASDVAAVLPKPFAPRSLLSLLKQFLTQS